MNYYSQVKIENACYFVIDKYVHLVKLFFVRDTLAKLQSYREWSVNFIGLFYAKSYSFLIQL